MEITAFFPGRNQAEAAAAALSEKGIDRDKMSVVYLTDIEGDRSPDIHNATLDAAMGGSLGEMAGLMLGARTTAIPEVGVIAAAGPVSWLITEVLTGSAIGGLGNFGISDDDTRFYADEIRRGKVYFSVPVTKDNGGTVSKILRGNNAINVEIHKGNS